MRLAANLMECLIYGDTNDSQLKDSVKTKTLTDKLEYLMKQRD